MIGPSVRQAAFRPTPCIAPAIATMVLRWLGHQLGPIQTIIGHS